MSMALWPFKPSTLLDADTMKWHVDNACWLIRQIGKMPMGRDSRLVLPSKGYFTADGEGHAFAEAVFDQVKAYAGMADWPVHLVSDVDTYKHQRGDLIQAASRNTPLGVFMRDHENGVAISYAPKLLKVPGNLIATFAHELSHYLIHSIPFDLPWENDEEEFLTDQTACLLGFGIFLANSAVNFEQWSNSGAGTKGWSRSRIGYLPEADLIFDTALFLTWKGNDATAALPCLKPYLADQLKRAMKDAAPFRQALLEAEAEARPA
jgi:hypothetical protein